MRDDADRLACPRTTGTPEMPRARVSSSTSRIVMSGETVIGSLDDAALEFLDLGDFAGLGFDASCSCG